MLANLNGWHAVILLVVVVLLFGATKLPGLAKSVGQSMKIFKNEIKNTDSDKADDAPSEKSADSNTTSKS